MVRKANLVLLKKLLWSLGSGSNELWKPVLFHNCNIHNFGWYRGLPVSGSWSFQLRKVFFFSNLHHQFRSMWIRLWEDLWCGERPIVNDFCSHFTIASNLRDLGFVIISVGWEK